MAASSKLMLTVRADCDLDALARELDRLGVDYDRERKPLPLDAGEQSVTVSVKGSQLPAAVKKIEGVLQAHPSSKMSLF